MNVLDETFSIVLRQRNVARDGLQFAMQQRDQANQFALMVLMAWMFDLKDRFKLEREVLRLQRQCGKRATVYKRNCGQTDTVDATDDLL